MFDIYSTCTSPRVVEHAELMGFSCSCCPRTSQSQPRGHAAVSWSQRNPGQTQPCVGLGHHRVSSWYLSRSVGTWPSMVPGLQSWIPLGSWRLQCSWEVWWSVKENTQSPNFVIVFPSLLLIHHNGFQSTVLQISLIVLSAKFFHAQR